jgi:nucleotide-binding universal stress UspA family protein
MTYSTLMVHLDLGVSNEGLLRITADLAQRFNAHVIGIAADQPLQITYGDAYMCGDLAGQDRVEMESETHEAEACFRAALHARAPLLEWRSAVRSTSLAAYVAQQARAADLLITGPDQEVLEHDFSRRVNVSDLVMRAGRPILLVPSGVAQISLESVVIGWKETPETHRAIHDALPLLKMAGHVTVVEIVSAEARNTALGRVKDVVDWLKRHHIEAEPLVIVSTGDDTMQLDAIAQEKGAGLLVAGAYGHSRLHEWMLGGVTRNLMLHPGRCSLVSH